MYALKHAQAMNKLKMPWGRLSSRGEPPSHSVPGNNVICIFIF
jgi:hypothetical protein